MAKQTIRGGKVSINLTSMMDVTFLLIVFFILVSNFSQQTLPPLKVPAPTTPSVALLPDGGIDRAVVNVVPDENRPGYAQLINYNGNNLGLGSDAYRQLAALLAQAYELNPEVRIDLRADKTLRYDEVQPVMQAITEAKIHNINLVAEHD